MRSYEELQYAFQQLELAALYREAGKLDAFIAATGSALRENEDFLYANWYELLDAVADFTDIREDEDTLTCRMYFSDAVIRNYFCFAQGHAEQAGIPLKQDPYYLDALWITAHIAAGSVWSPRRTTSMGMVYPYGLRKSSLQTGTPCSPACWM